jgi:prepilin-type N-terminal cleavage/methylation domain-containing protein
LKKAFTLIEVMISVMIVFIVVNVAMNIVGNNKKLIELFLDSKNFALKASVAFLENKDVKNNYERLTEFNIKDDEIIHTLKKDEIRLDIVEDTREEYNFSNFNFTKIINKLNAYNKTHSCIIYSIGIQ